MSSGPQAQASLFWISPILRELLFGERERPRIRYEMRQSSSAEDGSVESLYKMRLRHSEPWKSTLVGIENAGYGAEKEKMPAIPDQKILYDDS